jgi:hypothetical protein
MDLLWLHQPLVDEVAKHLLAEGSGRHNPQSYLWAIVGTAGPEEGSE